MILVKVRLFHSIANDCQNANSRGRFHHEDLTKRLRIQSRHTLLLYVSVSDSMPASTSGLTVMAL